MNQWKDTFTSSFTNFYTFSTNDDEKAAGIMPLTYKNRISHVDKKIIFLCKTEVDLNK
jgi:hypothetical protein